VELPTPTRVLIALTVDYRCVLGIVALMGGGAAGIFLWCVPKEGGTASMFQVPSAVIGDTLLKFQVAQFPNPFDATDGGTPLWRDSKPQATPVTSKLLAPRSARQTQMVREGESLHAA